MRKLLLIAIFFIVSYAHEAKENRAKVSIYENSTYLKLSIHSNKWSESFKIDKLDDAILKDTLLSINRKILPLKLRKIQKRAEHYEIEYLATKGVESKVSSLNLTLPKELGNVIVTVVRANSKLKTSGKKISFLFD